MVLKLDEIVVLPEDLGVHPGQILGTIVFAFEERLVDFGAEASRRREEALRVGFEKLVVDARTVVVAVERRDGGELAEVAIAF